MRVAALIFTIFWTAGASASDFDAPWKNQPVVLVIDSFYANSIDWTKLAAEQRVVAIIHRATVGTKRIDPAYNKRKEQARQRGYFWDSYHRGVAGDPEKQADFYIDTVKPIPDELISLDLEDAQSMTLMTVDEAILFVGRIKARTERYPVLYTTHPSAKLISSKYKDSVFVNTPLWYARSKRRSGTFRLGFGQATRCGSSRVNYCRRCPYRAQSQTWISTSLTTPWNS
jgi:GH25 family lysozyme M1 (1,4-beta-N-acetylmuramidase)